MKPTAESVGISNFNNNKLCRSFITFLSGYCRFQVEIQYIPVDIDTAYLFFTAFPFFSCHSRAVNNGSSLTIK